MSEKYLNQMQPESEDQILALRDSYRKVGPIREILVNKKTGHIIGGAHRKVAVPEWPIKEIEVEDELQEEILSIHDNTQRQMSQTETISRIERICELIHRLKAVPLEDCFQAALKLGAFPYHDDYVRSLCPLRYRGTVRVPLPKEPVVEVKNVEDAVEKVVEAREKLVSYGPILKAKDIETGKPFVAEIKNPDAFFDALHTGASKETLLRHAIEEPVEEGKEVGEPSKLKEQVKLLLRCPHCNGEPKGVFIDDLGNKHRVLAIYLDGELARYEGEEL